MSFIPSSEIPLQNRHPGGRSARDACCGVRIGGKRAAALLLRAGGAGVRDLVQFVKPLLPLAAREALGGSALIRI